MTEPLLLLPNLSPARFLLEYWQKQPLFAPSAVSTLTPALSADELAWLAMQPDVESRLVFTEFKGDSASYRLESGPFSEQELTTLPDNDWTLLVQDVDKHLPDFRQHLAIAACIPDWRIDDLMISFAAPGGSVGPHLDNYDVFLVQAEGHRQWRIGLPDAAQRDDSSAGLSLLQPFAPTSVFDAAPGDVLYLPPGIPHWGVAADQCMTYSIGMRAPTSAELRAGASRVLDREFPLPPGAEDLFYTDADLSIEEAEAGRIHERTVSRVREQALLDVALSDRQVAVIVGSVVTDPKAWLLPDPVDDLSACIDVHGMARIAWFDDGATRLAFANGIARSLSAEELPLMRDLCRTRRVPHGAVTQDVTPGVAAGLAEWLRKQGVFDGDQHA